MESCPDHTGASSRILAHTSSSITGFFMLFTSTAKRAKTEGSQYGEPCIGLSTDEIGAAEDPGHPKPGTEQKQLTTDEAVSPEKLHVHHRNQHLPMAAGLA